MFCTLSWNENRRRLPNPTPNTDPRLFEPEINSLRTVSRTVPSFKSITKRSFRFYRSNMPAHTHTHTRQTWNRVSFCDPVTRPGDPHTSTYIVTKSSLYPPRSKYVVGADKEQNTSCINATFIQVPQQRSARWASRKAINTEILQPKIQYDYARRFLPMSSFISVFLWHQYTSKWSKQQSLTLQEVAVNFILRAINIKQWKGQNRDPTNQ